MMKHFQYLLLYSDLGKQCTSCLRKHAWQNHNILDTSLPAVNSVLLYSWGRHRLLHKGLRVPSCFYTSATHPQDYGKFGVVDMDDKQKLFKLIKRLNIEPVRSTHGESSDKGVPTPRVNGSVRGSGKDSNVDALEARLKAQMLDGNAALLSLADDPDDYLFQVCQAFCVSITKSAGTGPCRPCCTPS